MPVDLAPAGGRCFRVSDGRYAARGEILSSTRPSHPQPSTLLQRVAFGDAAAVHECIDRYGGLVWSLARRLIASTADAEDAVQEVFIDVWKSAGRFDPGVASEATFVAMIARRRLIDHRRRQQRRPERAQAAPLDEVDVAAPLPASDALEVADEHARAAAAIRELTPDQQQVLRLSVYDGWSHQRIADHLQLPLGTVKTHVRRGLIRIRERLNASPPTGAEAEGGP